jgi:hypothetical protein
MLYRSTDRLCHRGARMQNLAHSASFHSREKTAPSKPGIKHQEHGWRRSAVVGDLFVLEVAGRSHDAKGRAADWRQLLSGDHGPGAPGLRWPPGAFLRPRLWLLAIPRCPRPGTGGHAFRRRYLVAPNFDKPSSGAHRRTAGRGNAQPAGRTALRARAGGRAGDAWRTPSTYGDRPTPGESEIWSACRIHCASCPPA